MATVVLADSLRLFGEHIHMMLFVLLSYTSTLGATEDVVVLLFWKVHVIVSIGCENFVGSNLSS